jgi:hypothetical protein
VTAEVAVAQDDEAFRDRCGDRVAGMPGFADTAVLASFGLPRTIEE